MWTLSTDGRRRKREKKRNEREQNGEMLTPFGRCLLFFSFLFPLPSCTPSDDCICQFSLFFSFLTCCVRMRMKTEMRSLFSSLFLPCSCQQLVSRKSKKFSASFFFIRVIYMRALKDDARFDLFLTLYTVYMHEKKKENSYKWQVKKKIHRIIIELNKNIFSWVFKHVSFLLVSQENRFREIKKKPRWKEHRTCWQYEKENGNSTESNVRQSRQRSALNV